MKKIAKTTIFNILSFLCVLMLVSCDGGGDGGGGGGGGGGDGGDSSVPNNERIRNSTVIAYPTLIPDDRIEYYAPGNVATDDILPFVQNNITDNDNPGNRFGRAFVYDAEPGGPQDFELRSTPEAGEPSARDRLQNAVNRLIGLVSGVDSNTDFIALIRGDVPMDIPRMAELLNGQGAQVVGGDLVSLPQGEDDFFAVGPFYYDNKIDSTYNAIYEAGVIEGNYNLWVTRRVVFLDNATTAERAQLDAPTGGPLDYKIPRIADDQSFSLNSLIAQGNAFRITEGARFSIFVQNTNTGR